MPRITGESIIPNMEAIRPVLTDNQALVLEFVKDEIAINGRAPSLKSIAKEMGWNAHSTAAGVVGSLIRLGLLRRRKGYAIKLPRAKT
jgi:hypothetical protein